MTQREKEVSNLTSKKVAQAVGIRSKGVVDATKEQGEAAATIIIKEHRKQDIKEKAATPNPYQELPRAQAPLRTSWFRATRPNRQARVRQHVQKSLPAHGRHKNARPAGHNSSSSPFRLQTVCLGCTSFRHRNEMNLRWTCENPPRKHVRRCCLGTWPGARFNLSLTSTLEEGENAC